MGVPISAEELAIQALRPAPPAAAATFGRTDLGFDLGDRLGHGSPAAFSTAFRNCSGTSPRTYRKAARGERASPGAARSDTL